MCIIYKYLFLKGEYGILNVNNYSVTLQVSKRVPDMRVSNSHTNCH